MNQNKGVTEPLWIGHELLHICVLFLAFVADNGSMYFWDWKTGHNFQRLQAAAQPGSLDSEAGIFAMTFDQSSSRLITCEADKTIKIYKEDDTAVCWSDARAPAPLKRTGQRLTLSAGFYLQTPGRFTTVKCFFLMARHWTALIAFRGCTSVILTGWNKEKRQGLDSGTNHPLLVNKGYDQKNEPTISLSSGLHD